MKQQAKSIIANVTLLVTAGVGTLLLIEVVFRLLGYGNLEIYDTDPRLYWKLKPNQECVTKIGFKPVRINSRGTRGEDFTDDKPASTFRVICLGDSRTYGWGLREADTYAQLLEDSLQLIAGRSKTVEVINAGVNAWSYNQMFVYCRDSCVRYDPDVIILGEANLWADFDERSPEEFKTAFLRRVWLKNLLRRSALYHYLIEVKLQKFYSLARDKMVPKVVREDESQFRSNSSAGREAIKNEILKIGTLTRQHNIALFLLYIPQEMELTDSTARMPTFELKREVSMSLGTPFVDVTREFASNGKVFQEADPVHPNERGNQIIAAQLVQALRANMQLFSALAQ